ncbi:hypothetical protein FOL47_006121 [Perkinsus chesapeaki]|uniref:Uncharacterized protein n=1 Tax=Perkinsus chesapeaki TaxID=330153 RepID=A0A7J6MY28_PERCH|nr:hypothetical protein FOL47_006121 [Perkinsus chesapeaki]
MAEELTLALRKEQNIKDDPSQACLATALLPRVFLAAEVPDIDEGGITKVLTLGEVKSILKGLLDNHGQHLSMDATVQAVMCLHHSKVEVTDSILEVVLRVHRAAMASMVNGDLPKKEYLEQLVESMKVMKYFRRSKVASEGFLPYYQRALSMVTKDGYYDECMVEALIRLGKLLRLRTFTRVMRSYRERFESIPPSELARFPQLLERFDVRDSRYFEIFLVRGVLHQLPAFTIADIRTLVRSLSSYKCPYPTEPEPLLRLLFKVAHISPELDSRTLSTLLGGVCSSLTERELARGDVQEYVRELMEQLELKSSEDEHLPDSLAVLEAVTKSLLLREGHGPTRRLLTRAIGDVREEIGGAKWIDGGGLPTLVECISLGFDYEPKLMGMLFKEISPAIPGLPKGDRVRTIKALLESAPVELAELAANKVEESKILEGLREVQLPAVASIWMGVVALTNGNDARLDRLASFISESDSSTLGDLCRAWAALGACDATIVDSSIRAVKEAIKSKLGKEVEPRHIKMIYGSISHPKHLKEISSSLLYEAASFDLPTKCALYAAISSLHDAVGAAELMRLIVKQLNQIGSQKTSQVALDELYNATVQLSLGNIGNIMEDHKGLTTRVLRQYSRAITDFAPKRRKRNITAGGAMFAVSGASLRQTRRLVEMMESKQLQGKTSGSLGPVPLPMDVLPPEETIVRSLVDDLVGKEPLHVMKKHIGESVRRFAGEQKCKNDVADIPEGTLMDLRRPGARAIEGELVKVNGVDVSNGPFVYLAKQEVADRERPTLAVEGELDVADVEEGDCVLVRLWTGADVLALVSDVVEPRYLVRVLDSGDGKVFMPVWLEADGSTLMAVDSLDDAVTLVRQAVKIIMKMRLTATGRLSEASREALVVRGYLEV